MTLEAEETEEEDEEGSVWSVRQRALSECDGWRDTTRCVSGTGLTGRVESTGIQEWLDQRPGVWEVRRVGRFGN